jgi:hypothetical protein
MLDRKHSTLVGAGKGNELADRGSQPSIPRGRTQAIQCKRDRVRLTNRIASRIHNPTSEMSGVQINRDYP